MTRSSSRSRILRSERSIKSHVNWDRCRMDLVKQGHGMAEARKWNEVTRYLHVALTKGCGWCEFKFRLGRFRKRDLSQRVNPTATAWNIWTRSHCWSGDFGPVLSPSPWRQLYPWMMLGALILLWGWCHSPQWFRRPVQCKAICSIAYLIVQLCSFRHIKAEQWIWRLIFFWSTNGWLMFNINCWWHSVAIDSFLQQFWAEELTAEYAEMVDQMRKTFDSGKTRSKNGVKWLLFSMVKWCYGFLCYVTVKCEVHE